MEASAREAEFSAVAWLRGLLHEALADMAERAALADDAEGAFQAELGRTLSTLAQLQALMLESGISREFPDIDADLRQTVAYMKGGQSCTDVSLCVREERH